MPRIKNVNGHYEVYDDNGQFLFSADTISEAVKELENEQGEKNEYANLGRKRNRYCFKSV